KIPSQPDSYSPCHFSLAYWNVSFRPGAPSSSTLRAAAGRSFQAAFKSNLNARARLGRITLRRYPPGSPHGSTTPSRIERLGSPSTSSAFTSRRVPSPEHVGQVVRLPIDSYAHEALLLRRLEHVAKLTLTTAHQRRQNLDLGPLGPLEHQRGDLRCALALDRRAVLGAMRDADARPQEPQV